MPFSSVFAEQRLKLIRKLATARKLGEIPYDELVQLVGKQPQSETVRDSPVGSQFGSRAWEAVGAL